MSQSTELAGWTREALQAVLADWVREALDLRFAAEVPSYSGAAPAALAEALLDVRRRMDRVEELLGRALRLRGHAARQASIATATVEDAWDEAVVARRATPVLRGDDYATARERHAHANLAVLDQRRAARQATEAAHLCDESVDVLRLTHRGLDGLRQDLLAAVRVLSFESHLER